MLRISRKFAVCAVGAGTRDVFVKSSHFDREPDKNAPDGFDACFPMGAKLAMDDIIFETGGGATNAAVTLRRFGLKTACACAVGKDQNGQDVITALKEEKVDTQGVQVLSNKKTSYSVIFLADTGQRSILVYRGAANFLDISLIPWNRLKSGWVYLTSLGGDLKKNKGVFAHAAHNRSRIAWNPGNGELNLGLKKLSPLLSRTSIMILNKEEAAVLAGKLSDDLAGIIKTLGKYPEVALVVTDGKNGAYTLEKSSGKLLYAPALPGKRINTTGAGDAFGSGFLAGYIKSANCETALKVGMLNSLGVITHMGAKAGILKKYPDSDSLKRVRIKHIPLT